MFVLGTQVYTATIQKIASVEAEVNNKVLTDMVEAVKKTVQPGRHVKPSFKVTENQAQQVVLG
jgi:flagellar motor switch protein FliM